NEEPADPESDDPPEQVREVEDAHDLAAALLRRVVGDERERGHEDGGGAHPVEGIDDEEVDRVLRDEEQEEGEGAPEEPQEEDVLAPVLVDVGAEEEDRDELEYRRGGDDDAEEEVRLEADDVDGERDQHDRERGTDHESGEVEGGEHPREPVGGELGGVGV